jgi:hypothetical protein
MGWKEPFARIFGPGIFTGSSVGDLWRMLRQNRFRVHPQYGLRLAAAVNGSTVNSISLKIEEIKFAKKWKAIEVPPPIFVLGHWRTGTTHLHNLLACDRRFAYPNLYQVLYPHAFLSTEATNSRVLSIFLPETRFGLDNMRLDWSVPYEDEFALAATGRSAYLGWTWPRQQSQYDRYLTMRGVSPEEVNA